MKGFPPPKAAYSLKALSKKKLDKNHLVYSKMKLIY